MPGLAEATTGSGRTNDMDSTEGHTDDEATTDGVARPADVSRRRLFLKGATVAGGALSTALVLRVGEQPAGAAPGGAQPATLSGPAGGVLSGTYPNPGFAEDMATQAEVDAEREARTAALAAHQVATTDVHGIVDTADLVRSGDARLADERTPADASVTVAKIAVGVLRGDVRCFGATGDGSTDDTAALQAAIDASEAVFLPHGTYRLGDTLRLRSGTHLHGEGMGGQDRSGVDRSTSVLDATAPVFRGQKYALQGASAGVGLSVENLWLKGPAASEVHRPGDYRYGSTGLDAGYSAQGVSLRHLRVTGFAQGIHLAAVSVADLVGVYVSGSRNHCLNIISLSGQVTIVGGIFSNAAGAAAEDRAANIYLGEGAEGPAYFPRNVTIVGALIDESFGIDPSGVRVDHAQDVNIISAQIYNPYMGYGLYVGGASERVGLSNSRIRPYHPSYAALHTIRIEPGARSCSLSFVSTDPNGGGDILDEGTGTAYFHVNSTGRSAAIPPPDGGAVVDAEARQAIAAILDGLRNAGLTA